ncbi:MAG: nuclear transport factor 2 family protein [Burkholderiaceae bacterium]|nr:nuclear transport factor 2 family protein [Burkholderiaceae bacterium]
MINPPIFTTAEAVEEAFYDALNRGDLQSLMALWSDQEEVVCVHPGRNRLVGIEAVRASWAQILEAGMLDIRCTQLNAFTGITTAVHSVIEEIEVRGQRGVQVVRCVATNVYVKDPSGWRIVVHHSSPADDQADPPASPKGTVLH